MMKKGLLMVNTGDGKGKTTAALGVMMRAWGRGMRVCMLQFLKSGDADYGEYETARRLVLDIQPLGDGCTWSSEDLEKTRQVNLQAWETAQQRILSGEYDLIVLDEFTHLLHFEWLDVQQTVDWIVNNKPANLHLIITGRYAPQSLITAADLVTEMVEIKHPYKDQGLLSQPGIDR
jgi:cob(I)alamin adenosyltransferase